MSHLSPVSLTLSCRWRHFGFLLAGFELLARLHNLTGVVFTGWTVPAEWKENNYTQKIDSYETVITNVDSICGLATYRLDLYKELQVCLWWQQREVADRSLIQSPAGYFFKMLNAAFRNCFHRRLHRWFCVINHLLSHGKIWSNILKPGLPPAYYLTRDFTAMNKYHNCKNAVKIFNRHFSYLSFSLTLILHMSYTDFDLFLILWKH